MKTTNDWSIQKAQAYGGVLIRASGHILLREPTNHFDGYVWTFPKGKPDPDETPETTALREVLEETGYQAEILGVLPGVFCSGLSSNAYYVMRTVGEQGSFQWETHSTQWVDFKEAAVLLSTSLNKKGRERDLAVLAAVQTWFESNQSLIEPKRKCSVIRVATQYDWRIHPLPFERVTVYLDFKLSAKESERIRFGFIPSVMEEKWFAYFANNTLYQHRSWTGYCIDQIHFISDGSGLRATHAEVNRNPEQYAEQDNEQDIRRIEAMVRELGQGAWDNDSPSAFGTALALATQPNYLGSLKIVAELFEPYFHLQLASWNGEASYADKLAMHHQMTNVFCCDNTGYTRLPGWHNEAGLGANIIRYLGLDTDYCEGESLAMIVSEGLASVSVAFSDLHQQWIKAQQAGEEIDISTKIKSVGWFVITVFMGTNTAYFPGKTLDDILHSEKYDKLSCADVELKDELKYGYSLVNDVEQTTHQIILGNTSNFEKLLAELHEREEKKRKPPFHFFKLGITPGTELTFKLDQSVTCLVTENNKVVFQGQTISVSKAAVLALQNHGRTVKVARGPDYWLYNGQILSKMKNVITGKDAYGA